MISETDLAWAAGIMDADGSVTIQRLFWTSKKDGVKHDRYSLRIHVANTDLKMLNKLQELFGGPIIKQPKYISGTGCLNPRNKMAWNWCIHATKAEAVLRLILPYMVTKRERAEIGLLVRKFARPKGPRGVDPNHGQVVALYDQMKTLNQRGVQNLQ